MEYYALPTKPHTIPPADRIIAVGMFDGLHIGHRAVLSRALVDTALSPAVFTFAYAGGPKPGECLQTAEERRRMLEQMGFSALFEADFNALRDLSPAAFVQMLAEELGAKSLVCGFNFRFGKNGAGDASLLGQLCEQYGIRLIVQPPIDADGLPVSSTRLKEALTNGDMETVTRLMARPYTVSAPVIDGQHLGRRLGSPTINQLLPTGTALPRFGVYASLAIVHGHTLPSVSNIGVRPTVGSLQPLAETYILGLDEDLYHQEIPVQLLRFLRPEQQFSSIDALKAQIRQDTAQTEALFTPPHPPQIRAILFDFDNTLSDRQAAFRAFCRDWVQHHFPQLPEDKLVDAVEQLLDSSCYGLRNTQAEVFETACRLLPWQAEGITPSFEDLSLFWKQSYPAHTVLLTDAVHVLQALRQKGYRLGILTNGHSHIQNRKLDISGLRALVDDVVISGDEGIQKPDPEIFHRAALRLGVAPESCVFVGDHPKNDIWGGQNAGMRPIFMDWRYGGVTVEDPKVPHIHTLSELLTLL